ncbi:MAG TPA: helix-turn-helix transcriptional regulator [Flavobacterium sp.]|nr:helix-turn-helix transcriptional regulator [Flavobacterium sp.]
MLGNKIRKIRTLKGYSQEYISDKLKISQSAYSDIETNKSKLDIIRIKQIANVLEVDFSDLIFFDDNQIFYTSFTEKSKDWLIPEKVILESFERERQNYKEIISHLKEEISFLRNEIQKRI